MLLDGSFSTKSVEALVQHVSILDISAHIGCGGSFFDTCGKPFPAGGMSGLFEFGPRSLPKVTNCVVCKAFNVIRSIPYYALISHRVRIRGVIVRAVIDIQTKILLVSVVSVVANIGDDELRRGGASDTPAVPRTSQELSISSSGLIIRRHFIFVHRGSTWH